MGYAFIRHEFIKKTDGFNGRLHHDNRTLSKMPDNVIIEKSDQNIYFVEPKPIDPKVNEAIIFLKGITKEMKEFKKEHPESKNRDRRGNASFAFETLISATDRTMPIDKILEFYGKVFEKFKERVKGHDIITAVVHMDETFPHLQIITGLFNHDKKKWGRKDLFGYDRGKDTKKSFYSEQDWVYELGKEYGLERGKDVAITKAKHSHPLHPNQVKEEVEKLLDSDEFIIYALDEAKADQLNDPIVREGLKEEIKTELEYEYGKDIALAYLEAHPLTIQDEQKIDLQIKADREKEVKQSIHESVMDDFAGIMSDRLDQAAERLFALAYGRNERETIEKAEKAKQRAKNELSRDDYPGFGR